MFRSYYAILLSLTISLIIHCDIIDKTNGTVNNEAYINKFSESMNLNITNMSHDDLLFSSYDNRNDINDNVSQRQNKKSLNMPPLNSDNFITNSTNKVPSILINGLKINDTRYVHILDLNESDVSSIDDMPTFVEYQQRIEKESKQKREKSDSIPSSPTLILKDISAVKRKSEQSSVEQAESQSSLVSPRHYDNKDDNDDSYNIYQMRDDQKIELTTSILSKTLLKNNVAAQECGAKILEISKQIKQAGSILNNNKDEYLNVPCTATEKWFILETCEPVQIRSIQIANFEMFSSRPKTFKVSTADRYPVKHWYNLGMFKALDEKGIQTFEVSDTRMVKYLKFEMLDHYGNEHYCPLTLVRVMGNVVIDDMDEGHSDDQPAMVERNEATIEVAPKIDSSDGLLTKAKEMIAKIVLGIGQSKQQDSQRINPSVSGTDLDDYFVLESPCYFFQFLATNNYQRIFLNISFHFLRLKHLQQYLPTSTKKGFPMTLFDLPFPSQIRVDYFTLSALIAKTEYSFPRLYHSFVNVSTYCFDQCFSRSSIHDLKDMLKCRHVTIMPDIKEGTSEDLRPIEIEEHVEIDDLKSTVIDGSLVDEVYIATRDDTGRGLFDDKVAPQRYKSDDIFDYKVSYSTGNNAWNYAFMKIKNITKELEVNVSISMTYLEELSQNYKQQTDKLKKTQLIMAYNVTRLENVINQHRQETRRSFKGVNVQLRAIFIALSLVGKYGSKSTMNLSTGDDDCGDILRDRLILPAPSIFESTIFLAIVNVSLSLIVNVLLLSVFYKKIRNSILDEVTKVITTTTSNYSYLNPSTLDKSTSTDDNTFQVGLPWRGVKISNYHHCDYYSDDDNISRKYRTLRPPVSTIQSVDSLVTTTKDKKKKRRK